MKHFILTYCSNLHRLINFYFVVKAKHDIMFGFGKSILTCDSLPINDNVWPLVSLSNPFQSFSQIWSDRLSAQKSASAKFIMGQAEPTAFLGPYNLNGEVQQGQNGLKNKFETFLGNVRSAPHPPEDKLKIFKIMISATMR